MPPLKFHSEFFTPTLDKEPEYSKTLNGAVANEHF